MKQSKLQSFVEVCVNVTLGYFTALLAQVIVFPWFGIHVNFSQNVLIGLIFTFIAVVRGYFVRRFFNERLHKFSESITARIS
jgi:hypothetical protein